MALSDRSVTILSTISVVAAVALLITSSLIVNDYKGVNDLPLFCKYFPKDCKRAEFRVIAGVLGIVGAIVQIASVSLARNKKKVLYCGLHFVTFLAVIVAVGLAIDSDLHNEPQKDFDVRGLVFISSAAIDGIYSLGVAGCAFLAKKAN